MKKEGEGEKNYLKKKPRFAAPFCLHLSIVAFYYRPRLEKGIIRPFVDPICRAPDGAWRIIYLLLDRTHTLPRACRRGHPTTARGAICDRSNLGKMTTFPVATTEIFIKLALILWGMRVTCSREPPNERSPPSGDKQSGRTSYNTTL